MSEMRHRYIKTTASLIKLQQKKCTIQAQTGPQPNWLVANREALCSNSIRVGYEAMYYYGGYHYETEIVLSCRP